LRTIIYSLSLKAAISLLKDITKYTKKGSRMQAFSDLFY